VLGTLLRAADDWCRAHGVVEMRLHCSVENTDGDAAWRALGFQPAQVLHRRTVPEA
jgi:GNAT superfamily N-acetyltransferase